VRTERLFINPPTHDVEMTKQILQLFGEATELLTNLDKTENFPIRCQQFKPRANSWTKSESFKIPFTLTLVCHCISGGCLNLLSNL
jgi:hypothetical protein